MVEFAQVGVPEPQLPNPTDIQAPRRAWYMMGWSAELAETPLARTILGQDLVAFRTSDGAPAVLVDECPHRFAPLSMGQVIGDTLRCPYHGLQFDRSGRCAKQHFPGDPPRNAKVRAWPVVEREGIIWVWMGEASRADPSLIPSFPYLVSSDYKTTSGISEIKANYQLITDNLMDLSHGEFIHPAFGGALLQGKHSVIQSGRTVESNWAAASVPPTVIIKALWPENPGVVDFWLEMRWDAPGSMLLDVGATAPGRPHAEGFHQPSVHILTPATDTTTHYFWNGGLTADHFTDINDLNAMFAHAFDHEDAPILEAVQRKMGARKLEDMKPVLLAPDAGAIRVRRILAEMIDQERAGEAVAEREPVTA